MSNRSIGSLIFYIIQKALRAGCARRNKEILPLCDIAAARKVDKPLRVRGRGAEAGLPTLFCLHSVVKEFLHRKIGLKKIFDRLLGFIIG